MSEISFFGGVMRGRRPKPTRLKLVTGNPGKRKLNKNEPDFAAETPTCPPHLDALAQEEWARVSADLLQAGLLTRADRAALAAYCQCYSTWMEAQLKLSQHGLVVMINQKFNEKTQRYEGGQPAPNPYLSIIDTALRQMRAFLVEFGLTPASRSRIVVPNKPKGNAFNALDAL